MTENDCARLRRVRPAAMRPGEPGRGAAFAAGRGVELLSAARRPSPLAPPIRPSSGLGLGRQGAEPIEDVLPAQGERGKANGPRRRRRLLGVSRCAAQNFWPSGILRGKTLRRPCFAKMPLFFSLRLSFFVSWLAVAPPSAVVASLGRGFPTSRFAPSLVVSSGFCLFLFPFRLDPVFVSCAAPRAKGRLSGAVGGPGKGARFDSLALSQEKADPEKKQRGIIHRNNSRRRRGGCLGLGSMQQAKPAAPGASARAARGNETAPKSDGFGAVARARGGLASGSAQQSGGAGALRARAAQSPKKKGAEGGGRCGAGLESASNALAGLLLCPASFPSPPPSFPPQQAARSPQPGAGGADSLRRAIAASRSPARSGTSRRP